MTSPVTALSGMDEAERQYRVAMRLYRDTKAKKPWDKLSGGEQRRYIDLSCQPEHRDDEGRS